jgi:phosphoglycerol transferase
MNNGLSSTTKKFSAVSACLYFLSFLLIGLSIWTEKSFGRVNLDQVISTMQFGVEGTLTADTAFIKRLVKYCFIFPLLFTFIFMRLERYHRLPKVPYLLLCAGGIAVIYQYCLLDAIHLAEKPQSDFFKAHYHNPGNYSFSTSHPKNLVLIYVESLEETYVNKQLFGHDLLASLHQLQEKNLSFAHFTQMPGTGWTIAGIISTQCSLPLNSFTVFSGNKQGEMLQTFLPKATCLSDILAQLGYQNVFMRGASMRFAGLSNFLRTHHYHEQYSKETWLAQGISKNEMSGWGLYDDDLFAQAKKKLAALMLNKKPFNLTLLTVDTHGLSGYLSPTCKKQGFHDFAGIVECTANQVSDFVSFIKQQGWLKDINIVIIGDHLAMKNAVYDTLSKSPERSIFNLIISSTAFHKNTEEIVHFDWLPTLLDVLNIHYSAQQLGLGYSALSAHAVHNPQRIADLERHIGNRSEAYRALW